MNKESLLLSAWRLNKKIPLLIAVLFIVNCVVFFGLQYYLSPRLEGLERRFIEAQSEMREQRAGSKDSGQAQEVFWRAQDDLGILVERIPPRAGLTAMIGELFDLAQAAGLNIDQINYDPKEVEGRDYLRYSLVFSVTGQYRQVKRFVYSLEQSDRLITIEEIGLTGESGETRGEVSLSLRFSTLFRKEVL